MKNYNTILGDDVQSRVAFEKRILQDMKSKHFEVLGCQIVGIAS